MPPIKQLKRSGWSKSGSLYTTLPQRAISLQVEFPVADTYTISFGLIPPKNTNADYRPKAEITWSVDGNQVEREITISKGTSISGRGEAVNVKAYDDMLGISPAVVGAEYTLLITLTKGVRASGQYPIFQPKNVQYPFGTHLVNDSYIGIANGTGATWDIPLGAVSVWPGISAPAAATNQIRFVFLDANGTGIANPLIDIQGRWVPIPSRAVRVQIFNSSGVAIDASLLFGIDG